MILECVSALFFLLLRFGIGGLLAGCCSSLAIFVWLQFLSVLVPDCSKWAGGFFCFLIVLLLLDSSRACLVIRSRAWPVLSSRRVVRSVSVSGLF